MARRRHSLLYTAYLRSPPWRLRRRLWIRGAGGRCEQCGRRRRPLTIHHRSYRRLGRERRSDIEVLCWRCHRARHRRRPPRRPAPFGHAIRALAALTLTLIAIHTVLIAAHAL
jgi:5-methylcytosine-specific restriction endonuclease McrA